MYDKQRPYYRLIFTSDLWLLLGEAHYCSTPPLLIRILLLPPDIQDVSWEDDSELFIVNKEPQIQITYKIQNSKTPSAVMNK